MAVTRKGKEIVEAKPSAAAAASRASSSGGKRKRALSAAGASAFPASGSSSRGGGSGRKKRGRVSSSPFIDDAAVDADGSDEFDDDDGDEGFGEDTEFMDDIPAGVKDVKRAEKSNIPLLLKEEELSGDELEEYIAKRYGHESDHVINDDDDKVCDDRKSLLHTLDDLTIWRVRCMVGYERRIAFCLIQKYVSLCVRGSNLPILSVFALEHIKGYVYIEADKQCDVAEACKGFCTLYTSKISLLPTNEVPRLLSIQNKSSEIAEGTWVRMKNGNYKGDLAQVVSVDAVRKRATVKLVPRIDLQSLAMKFGGGISLKHASNSAPRLLSSRELEDFRPHIGMRRDKETGECFEILDGLMLKDGYLYKKVSMLSLNCFGVQPSSAELMKFEPAKSDEPQVSEYISQLYRGRKGDSSEALDGSFEDKGDAIKLHDLVLFGRKDVGVIIGMKCDNFEILKGGVEEPVVITVQRREIKNSCIDKMFTAPDSHTKTICINDAIKVLEGPQKDRQGIVRHMYKGTLFVYDEEVTENTGFFCVNSKLCEVMKDVHKNMDHKSYHVGSKGAVECSSMPQSPARCSEQRDYDSGFKRYREGDRDQPFSVGQTLRIRVGPLKGYLCRVVRIYRSDVTVKLDSPVKLITVNCNQLSAANIKNFGNPRDDTISKPDEFGSIERLSKGELVDADMGEPSSKSSWDFELPSSTRVSLPGLSSWRSSSASCDDNKACSGQGDDPWGSKVTSGNGCQAGHSGNADEQRSQPATADGWSNWTRAEKTAEGNEQGDDRWGSKVNSGNGCPVGHSSNAEETKSQPADADGWSNWTKGEKSTDGNDQGNDPWGSEVKSGNGCPVGHSGNAAEQRSQPATSDDWSSRTKAEKSTEGEHEIWKDNGTNEGKKSGWSLTMSSNYARTDSQNRAAGGSGESNDKADWGGDTDRSGCLEAGHGFGSNRAEATTDGWGNRVKADKSTEDEHKRWKENNTNEGETGGWNKATSSNLGQANNWCRGTSSTGESDGKSGWGSHNDKLGHSEGGQGLGSKGSTDSWSNWNKAEKGNITSERETGSWNKAVPSNCGQADRWKNGADDVQESDGKGHWGHSNRPGHFEVRPGSGNSWAKAAAGGWTDWNKAEKSTGGESKSWKANDINDGETDGWSKARSSNHDQGGGWRGRPDIGGNCGSSWGRGGSRNTEAYGSGDIQDSGNRPRDSEGRQACGRGRGFNGSGRGRSQDDDWKGSCSDAGWSSGRGRGRGRRGRGVWEVRGNRGDYNDSSHSGHDGNEQSCGWKNDQGSCGHGDFSRGALSSWKSDQSSGWGTSSAFGKNEAFDDKKDSSHRWGEKEPFAGGSSGWNSGSGHSGSRNDGVSWERNEKPNVNQRCISNSGWDSDKLAVGPDKHVDGEQSASRHKEAANKWGSPEVYKNNQSSWSCALHGQENATGEDWSIKPKPLSADQPSGDTSASTGLQSSAWAGKSAVNEKVGEDGGWDRLAESGRKEEPTWGTDKRKGWNSPEGGGNQHSEWHRSAEQGVKSSATAGDNWEKGNRSPGRKDSESGNWHTAKAFGGSGSSSIWGQKSSGNEAGKAAGGGAGSWNDQKPNTHGHDWSSQGSHGGDWNSPNPSSSGKQTPDWRRNDEGSNWSKSRQFAGRPPSGPKNRSFGDGARRNDDRSGESYGGGGSSGWRGNMSFGRGVGRGRGKCFGQEQASGWSDGTRSDKEAGGADSSFANRQESDGGSKPTSWTRGKFANTGGGSGDEHGAWSRGQDPADGAKKGTAGEEGRRGREAEGTWGSWDSGAGTTRATGSVTRADWNNSASPSGWAAPAKSDQPKAAARDKAMTTSKEGGWEQKQCLDAAQGSDGWKSHAFPSEKASGEASRGRDNWEGSSVAAGWDSTSTSTNKGVVAGEDWAGNHKVDPDGARRPGGRGGGDASFGDWVHRRGGAHGSGSGSSWERSNDSPSNDGSAEKGGW